MKILALSAYFYPETTSSMQLNIDRFKALSDAGIESVLYVPIPGRGVETEVRQKYKKIKSEMWYDGKLLIHRFWLPAESKKTFMRFLRYLVCNIIQTLKCMCEKNVDVVYCDSTPPTQGLAAALIAAKHKVPFVYCLEDIFPESLVMTGMTGENSILYSIGKKVEKYIYEHSDKIIVISESFKNNLISKGVPEDKIEVINNWIDENSVVPVNRADNSLFDELGLSRDKFYVTYAGNLGLAQDIDVLIECAKMTIDRTDIMYIIFGSGGKENNYKANIAEYGLTNIKMFPMQPYSRVSEVYSLGNVSLVSCKKGAGGIALPSKTFSIMSAGTAVLASFDEESDLQKILEDSKAGIFISAEQPEEMKNAILKLSENNWCDEMGRNARKYIIDNLSKNIGTKKFVDVLCNL